MSSPFLSGVKYLSAECSTDSGGLQVEGGGSLSALGPGVFCVGYQLLPSPWNPDYFSSKGKTPFCKVSLTTAVHSALTFHIRTSHAALKSYSYEEVVYIYCWKCHSVETGGCRSPVSFRSLACLALLFVHLFQLKCLKLKSLPFPLHYYPYHFKDRWGLTDKFHRSGIRKHTYKQNIPDRMHRHGKAYIWMQESFWVSPAAARGLCNLERIRPSDSSFATHRNSLTLPASWSLMKTDLPTLYAEAL